MIRTEFPRDPSDGFGESEGPTNSPFTELNFPKLFSDVAMSFLEYLELENTAPVPTAPSSESEDLQEEPNPTRMEPSFDNTFLEEDFERKKERMESESPQSRMFSPPSQMISPTPPPADMYSGLSLRILGVPSKSRVETQLKLCLQLVNSKGANVTNWKYLILPEHLLLVNKRKDETKVKVEPGTCIKVEAGVICSSEHSREVMRCFGCIQRERKSVQRKKKDNDHEPEEPFSVEEEQKKILQFYCSSRVDFSYGEAIIPTRITCYCRHHGEKNGFQIWVTMKDSNTENVIAAALSSLVMITDDHKSKTTRTKRPRTLDIKQEEEIIQSHAPLIEKVIPSEGPMTGGIEITILGKEFVPGMRCVFGDNEALKTDYWGPTTLVCVLPPAILPGTVSVSLKDTLKREDQDDIMFTYKDDSDKMMMELALQVVGMKLTGKIHDARQIAMKIVENSNDESFTGGTHQVFPKPTDDVVMSDLQPDQILSTMHNKPSQFVGSPNFTPYPQKIIPEMSSSDTSIPSNPTNNSLKLYGYYWEDFPSNNGAVPPPINPSSLGNCRTFPLKHTSPKEVRLH